MGKGMLLASLTFDNAPQQVHITFHNFHFSPTLLPTICFHRSAVEACLDAPRPSPSTSHYFFCAPCHSGHYGLIRSFSCSQQ